MNNNTQPQVSIDAQKFRNKTVSPRQIVSEASAGATVASPFLSLQPPRAACRPELHTHPLKRAGQENGTSGAARTTKNDKEAKKQKSNNNNKNRKQSRTKRQERKKKNGAKNSHGLLTCMSVRLLCFSVVF